MRPLPWLTTVLVIFLLAGCGGPSEEDVADQQAEDYAAAVQDAIRPLSKAVRELIAEAGEAEELADLAPPLGRARRVFEQAQADLEAIEPPADAARLHDRLIRAQERIGEVAREAARGVEDAEADPLLSFQDAYGRFRDRSEEILTELTELGFPIL